MGSRAGMNRRTFIKLASGLTLGAGLSEHPTAVAQSQPPAAPPAQPPAAAPAQPAKEAFSEQWLLQAAENLSKRGFEQPKLNLPSELANLDQHSYQSIRFKQDATVWKNDPINFNLQFFHTGFQYKVPVEINLIEGDGVRTVPYSTALFDFDAPLTPPPPDSQSGFSGVRVLAPLNQPNAKSAFLIFQGASYFRAISAGQALGTWARGIGINTAQASGEEFPFYRAIWIKKPAPEERFLTIYALLDGQSVTGAYKFRAEPGRQTVMDVEFTLFPRKPLTHVGISPLASMFFFGAADPTRLDDYRPNVHSSNGLQIWNGAGEWIWRPLINPERLQYSVFIDKAPKGFGLLQRARAFSDFEDIDARFGDRPSVWVEPLGDWGDGAVDLIEVPSKSEIYDNIITFWRPKSPLADKASHQFRYRLYWGWEPPVRSTKAYAAQTRTGSRGSPDVRFFAIDFVSAGSCNGCNVPPFTANVRAGEGEIMNANVRDNPATGGQRVTFEFRPGGVQQTDLRCELHQNGQAISETWVYRWTAA
jgi:glucans biosynthesis protein